MKSKSKSLVIVAFLFLGFIITTIFSKCSSKTIEYKKTPPDTTGDWVSFNTPPQWIQIGVEHKAYTEFIDRITKDTTYFDTLDESTAKKIFKRDTSYWLTITQPDIDSTTGKVKLDSLKRPKIKNAWRLQLPRERIFRDYNNYIP